MRLRHTSLTLLACLTLATASLGCDGELLAEQPAAAQSTTSNPVDIEASDDAHHTLTALLETERMAHLRYLGLQDGHLLLASTLTEGPDGLTEVFNVRADLIDGPALEVLEEEGEVQGTVTPSAHSIDMWMATESNQVVTADPDQVAERLLATTAPTICGDVRARATVALSVGGLVLPATANYTPSMALEVVQGGSVIKAIACLYESNWWTGGSCADEGKTCTRIFNRAKRIMRQGCRGESTSTTIGGGVGGGVVIKPGSKPGVSVNGNIQGQKTYSVQWWEHSSSEQEERAFPGKCTFVDNLWPARNACVCELVGATHLAVAAWQNEELPSAQCTETECSPNGAPSCGG